MDQQIHTKAKILNGGEQAHEYISFNFTSLVRFHTLAPAQSKQCKYNIKWHNVQYAHSQFHTLLAVRARADKFRPNFIF